jgi:hypothetical protein
MVQLLSHKDEGARRRLSQIAIELQTKGSFERVPDLVLVLVKVQWRPLSRRGDAFERGQCSVGLRAPDLERQRTTHRVLDRCTLAGRKKDAA